MDDLHILLATLAIIGWSRAFYLWRALRFTLDGWANEAHNNTRRS